jgi:hypothetical protein
MDSYNAGVKAGLDAMCPNCLKLREALIRAGDTLYSVTKTGDWPDEVMETLQFITQALTQPHTLKATVDTEKHPMYQTQGAYQPHTPCTTCGGSGYLVSQGHTSQPERTQCPDCFLKESPNCTHTPEAERVLSTLKEISRKRIAEHKRSARITHTPEEETCADPADLCEECSAWKPEKYKRCQEPCDEYTNAIRAGKGCKPKKG